MKGKELASKVLKDSALLFRLERLLSQTRARINRYNDSLRRLGAIPYTTQNDATGICFSVLWPLGDGRFEMKNYHTYEA